MNAVTEAMPVGSAVSRATSSQRFFEICYLTAITVATVGWVSAFGWAAVRVAKWLLA
jgi:hypothetical protein